MNNQQRKEISKKRFFVLCKEEGYEVLGDYINNNSKIIVRCKQGHVTAIAPYKFKIGKRCGRCADNCPQKAKRNFLVLCEVEGIEVLGKYINDKSKVLIRCREGHVTSITPNSLKRGRRCSRCADNCPQKAKKKFEDFMKVSKRYSLITNYENAKTKVLVRCNWCGNEFFIRPYHLYTNKHGCPSCNSNDKKTAQEKFYQKLFYNNILALSDYQNTKNKIEVIHNECGNRWMIKPKFYRNRFIITCPHCKKVNGGKINARN